MYQLINTLEKPQNWLYTFFILFALGVWLLSFTGFVKIGVESASLEVEVEGEIDGDWADVLGFGSLPLAVWLTLLLMFVGILGISLNELFFPYLPQNSIWFGGLWAVNFSLASLVSIYAVRKTSKPLSLLFVDYGVAEQASNLVGKIARVSSGKVTHTFGEASLEIGGHTMEVAVRTASPDMELAYGQTVLLVHYDAEKHVFWCEKMD